MEASVAVRDGVRVALMWAISRCFELRVLFSLSSDNVGREKRPRLNSGQVASR
jgi:hypothetical protein